MDDRMMAIADHTP